MGKCKTKAIQADLDIFTNIPTYQAYSDIFSNLCNPGILRTRSIFSALAYSEPETYSEPSQTFTMERFAKIADGYNYFRKL